MNWYTKKNAGVMSYPYYIAIHSTGRLKGQAPLQISMVPELRRQWDSGGFGTGKKMQEFKDASMADLFGQLHEAGLDPRHDDIEFYEVRAPNSPRRGLNRQQVFSLMSKASSKKERPSALTETLGDGEFCVSCGFPIAGGENSCGACGRKNPDYASGGNSPDASGVFNVQIQRRLHRFISDVLGDDPAPEEQEDLLNNMFSTAAGRGIRTAQTEDDNSMMIDIMTEVAGELQSQPQTGEPQVPPPPKDGSTVIVGHKTVITRKPHTCLLCGKVWARGSLVDCIAIHRIKTHRRLGYYFCPEHTLQNKMKTVKDHEGIIQ
jgi:hypothetical protein